MRVFTFVLRDWCPAALEKRPFADLHSAAVPYDVSRSRIAGEEGRRERADQCRTDRRNLGQGIEPPRASMPDDPKRKPAIAGARFHRSCTAAIGSAHSSAE